MNGDNKRNYVPVVLVLFVFAGGISSAPPSIELPYRAICNSQFPDWMEGLDCEAYYLGLPLSYLERLYQPTEYPQGNPGSVAMLLRGYRSTSEKNWIFGYKNNRYSASFFDILAIKIPPFLSLIKLKDFSLYTIEGSSVPQYFYLGDIPVFQELGVRYHFNLCGPLIVATLTGEDPMQLLIKMGEDEPYQEFFTDEDPGMLPGIVVRMFRERDWEAGYSIGISNQCDIEDYAGKGNSALLGPETRCRLTQWFQGGYYVIAGVNLVSEPRYGIVMSDKYPTAVESEFVQTSHYVVILQLVESFDGNLYVRVYNPFHNREEWYFWNDFYKGWMQGEHEVVGTIIFVKNIK